MKYYNKLEEYRVLVFSTCKDFEVEQIGVNVADLNLFIESSKKLIRAETKNQIKELVVSQDRLDKH